MEIKLTMEEAKKLAEDDFKEIVSRLKDYTTKTMDDGWLIITNDGENKMIVNTYYDYDVTDDGIFKLMLYTYYYKYYIEHYKLKLQY